MKCHQTEQSTRGRSAAGYTYPNGRLLPSCFGRMKFTRFQKAKTSANKRFYNMSAKPITRLCGAKVVNYFELSKSTTNKNAIYAHFA